MRTFGLLILGGILMSSCVKTTVEPAHTYIKQLVDLGVGIYACSTCLEVAGFVGDDLMSGIQTAQKDKFFNFTKGRIITLDY
jgi:predicted peroxiredoxin